ncbi:hypothetical protein [Streptomyces griseocarneus]|uniref:Uncharacterized protein n=1 Tax=Streptomyces griseocarneus TaxID=51201 RepID=A0ABX7RVC1_9ACTN|nr:hypothetical protein [Streptomyces griseocarneus]QSY51757.1 hypothetical protein J3S04_13360 [Streptomyces griseocarneus]
MRTRRAFRAVVDERVAARRARWAAVLGRLRRPAAPARTAPARTAASGQGRTAGRCPAPGAEPSSTGLGTTEEACGSSRSMTRESSGTPADWNGRHPAA